MVSYQVGLLFGGRSENHEISIKSAMSIIIEMQIYSATYCICPFYIDRAGFWHDESDSWQVLHSGKPPNNTEYLKPSGIWQFPRSVSGIDVWLPALHGPRGEDGVIKGLLTMMGSPFVGAGVLGSAVGMDKWMMKRTFAHVNLPQLPYIGFDICSVREGDVWNLDLLTDIERSLGYPCFIKPASQGSPVSVSRATNRQKLVSALNLAAGYDRRLVVEQGKQQRCRELECGILANANPQASPVGEILHGVEFEFSDYAAKHTPGEQRFEIPAKIPREISQRVQEMAVRAFQAIDGQVLGRVGFLYSDTENLLFINEINTIPNVTTFSTYSSLWRAAGLDFPDLLHQLLKFTIQSS